MTNNEIQYFLDVLLPYSDKQKRSRSANNRLLSKSLKNRLYDIARKLCSDKILKKKKFYEFWEQAIENPDCKTVLWGAFQKNLTKDFDHILAQIADILKTIGYNQNLTRTNLKDDNGHTLYNKETHTPITITSGYTNMPFLIKQVLYLFSVRLLQANYAFEEPCYYQGNIFNELHNVHKIPISHNFISDMFGKITPTIYWKWIKYNQPENPLKYMGQKRDRLGVAIKHLVGQAELESKFDFYVDIFGGSSSASVAPVYKKGVNYIYNDIDRLLTNYVEVVASDSMHQKLIDKIIKLQNFIEFSFSTHKKYYNDLDKTIAKYLDSREDFSSQTSFILEIKKRIDTIRINGTYIPCYETADIEVFLQKFKDQVLDKISENDLEMKLKDFSDRGGKPYTTNDIRNFSTYGDFRKNHEVIRYLMLKYDKRKNPSWNMRGYFNNKRFYLQPYLIDSKEDRDMVETEWMYQQYRALGVLIECKRLYYKVYENNNSTWCPKNTEDKINAALVLIFMNYFRTNNEVGSDSSITLYFKMNDTINRFIEMDYKRLITEYHESIKRVKKKSIKNMDYSSMIKNYSYADKSVLFYVDSPYVGTKAYQKNETPWETKDMKMLIDNLFNSGQRFIFSMRACKDDQSYETDETDKKIFEVNKKILEVFKYFSYRKQKNNQVLYVLAVDFDMDNLEECIIASQNCEIMITNYPIHNFYDIRDKIDANFIKNREYKVLTFTEFFNIAGKALESF